MKRFLVERDVPGAGNMSAEDLKTISRSAVATIDILGKPYRWVETFITEDRFFCIHEAENIEVIQEYVKCGGFPILRIDELKTVINPATADSVFEF